MAYDRPGSAEGGTGVASDSDGSMKLPAYAGMMADYHRAFDPELRGVVAALRVRPGDLVVDVASGDGSYSRWLAERVGPAGKVLAVDVSPAFLDLAQRKIGSASVADRIRFVRMNLDRPALVEAAADLAWCAQSLYSLPDPVRAVRRMARLVRDGGRIAVFESDELHHVSLPWPVDVELALRRAELEAFEARSDRPAKFYIARDLPRIFREAGLPGCDVQSFAFCRRAPFDAPTRGFLSAYLADLRERTAPRLSVAMRSRVDELADPGSPLYLLDDPDSLAVCVDHLAVSPVRRA